VSRQEHCSFDLILRQQAKEFAAEIPLIISNHPDLEWVAKQFGIDSYYIPVNKDNKVAQEAKQLELLRQYDIDLVVLAAVRSHLQHRVLIYGNKTVVFE